MSSVTPLRDFDAVKRDLEDVSSRLEENIAPNERIELLRKQRILLDEADKINRIEEADSTDS